MLHTDPATFPSMFDSPGSPEDPGHATAQVRPVEPEGPGEPARPEGTGFAALGLPPTLVNALANQGIASPFPIQAATVPDALAARDVLGRGQTGSGKTLAFGLPTLARLAAPSGAGRGRPQSRRPRRPRALVLVPTRELAMQVTDALAPLGRPLGLNVAVIVGGASYERQFQALDRGVDILVATPGRLSDLIERGACSLDRVEITVLDEADQMADMGFLPIVTELLALTPESGQRLLFSATLDNDVQALVDRFLTDPVTHAVSPPAASVVTMEHHLVHVPPHEKFAVTASLAARRGRTIMFVKTQAYVDRLVAELAAVGVRAGALHGGKTQRVRTRTLAEFKEGTVDVLVATDVAARGIHVDDVSLVVHVDPPKDPKDYLHRAGRTARAGAAGTVLTLVLPRQRRSTEAMVARAGVEPSELKVRVGDPALAELVGAREPSGVPVVIETAVVPKRTGGWGRPGGNGRPGRDSGHRQGGRDGGHRQGGRDANPRFGGRDRRDDTARPGGSRGQARPAG